MPAALPVSVPRPLPSCSSALREAPQTSGRSSRDRCRATKGPLMGQEAVIQVLLLSGGFRGGRWFAGESHTPCSPWRVALLSRQLLLHAKMLDVHPLTCAVQPSPDGPPPGPGLHHFGALQWCPCSRVACELGHGKAVLARREATCPERGLRAFVSLPPAPAPFGAHLEVSCYPKPPRSWS